VRRPFSVLIAGVVLLAISAWVFSRREIVVHPDKPAPEATVHSKSAETPRDPASLSQREKVRIPQAVMPERVFRAILDKHRNASGGRPKPGPGYITRFMLEARYGFRECRLFALTHPEEAESLARKTALEPGANADDIAASLYVLRILAQAGRPAALQTLHDIASSEVSDRGRLALAELGQADRDGAYRALYWKRCEEGVLEGYEAASNWPDPTTIKVMERITVFAAGKPDPWPDCAWMAKETIAKVQILINPASDGLEKLLKDPKDNLSTSWAIRAGRFSKYPKLEEILRARLDAGLEEGKQSGSWELTHVTDGHLGSISDHDFDEVLVAFSELGGKLSDWESQRLRHFGYACDPKQRLNELVGPVQR
jgi:hypothetical protein